MTPKEITRPLDFRGYLMGFRFCVCVGSVGRSNHVFIMQRNPAIIVEEEC